MDNKFLTFIIPTMGRKSLKRAVDSTTHQTSHGAKTLVAFDSRYEPNFESNHPDVRVEKSDAFGHAGKVRNFALGLADTDWVAFLDDDDYVLNTYVEHFRNNLQAKPDLDIVIFTYRDEVTGNVQPPKRTKDFTECHVGISFAIRKNFIDEHNIRFTDFSIEDFRFLDTCRTHGAKYIVTNDIQYIVGGIGGWVRKD